MTLNKDLSPAEKYMLHYFAAYHARSYSSLYMYWMIENRIFNLFDRELLKFKTDTKIKVLDLGCAFGMMIFELARRHQKIYQSEFTGIDISPDLIEIAKKIQPSLNLNYNFFVADVEQGISDIENDAFDIIICSNVLEHLVNSKTAVEEIKRMLKPGGLAIIAVPNYEPLQYKALKFIDKALLKDSLRRIFYKGLSDEEIIMKFDYGHAHISERSYSGWKRLFKEAGLKIECAKTTSFLRGSYFFDRRPIISGSFLILDSFMKFTPFCYLISTGLIFGLRK